MSQKERLTAALAYVFILGWVLALLMDSNSKLVRFHLKQSILTAAYVVVVFAVWAILAWGFSFIAFAGMLVAVLTFTLVIAAALSVFPLCLVGIINAWRGRFIPVPLIGEFISRLPV